MPDAYKPGQTATMPDGSKIVFQGGAWRGAQKQQTQDASMRSRMDLGLGPMVAAESNMEASEAKAGGNPYSGLRAGTAKTLADASIPVWGGAQLHPLDGVAKVLGGQDFQDYQQAAAAFESQLMPIMSGAAVSPSEAQRQIRAALPELGDSAQTLARKGEVRKMMLNGAAHARGTQIPYPDVQTWGVNTVAAPKAESGATNDPLGIRPLLKGR